jgi:beta-N-acetylhexosaminidase
LSRLLSIFGSVAALALWVPQAGAATLEQMAGQMILVGFQGDSVDDASIKGLIGEIGAGTLGGVMYLKPNVRSLDAVKQMNAAFLEAAPKGLPPFIALDQEGGAVQRLTGDVGFPETPSAASIASGMAADEARVLYGQMADGLHKLGFNYNFGPVADLDVNPDNPVIAKFGRSYSDNSFTVFSYDAAFIEAHHEKGIVTSLKHFPGHGSSTTDSHEGFVDISGTWSAAELAPYKLLLRAKVVDSIMVGHLYHDEYADAGNAKVPASLSSKWITGVLRQQLGFDGVVVSDDLEMSAVRDHFPLRERILMAVRAGVDILLFSNTARPRPEIAGEVRSILVAEAESDPAFKARIEASYARIVALKARIGG